MKRQYGKSRTNLTLSSKASELYSGSDPFEIYEYEDYDEDTDEAVYTYSYRAWGNPETRRMTEDELNADLEALADAMNDENAENDNKLWYAVVRRDDYPDWGTGSYSKDEAMHMARDYGTEYYIAVGVHFHSPYFVHLRTLRTYYSRNRLFCQLRFVHFRTVQSFNAGLSVLKSDV